MNRSTRDWGRLRPPKIDLLEDIGLPSKGDKRLLDFDLQETFYAELRRRFSQLSEAQATTDQRLEVVLASLSIDATGSQSASKASVVTKGKGNGRAPEVANGFVHTPAPSNDLSKLLIPIRKLREGLLASSRLDVFSQRVLVFSARVAILCSSFEAYLPAISSLLSRIHPVVSLPREDFEAFLRLYILDLCCRQRNFQAAMKVRMVYGFEDETTFRVMHALIHDNWPSFWAVRDDMNVYQRKIMAFAEKIVTQRAIQCLEKCYFQADKGYVERCTGKTWELLQSEDAVSWEEDGSKETIIIKRTKGR